MAGQQGARGGQGTPGQYHLYIHELFIRPVSLCTLCPVSFKVPNELFSGSVSLLLYELLIQPVNLQVVHKLLIQPVSFHVNFLHKLLIQHDNLTKKVSTSLPFIACEFTRISMKFSYILVSMQVSL